MSECRESYFGDVSALSICLSITWL